MSVTEYLFSEITLRRPDRALVTMLCDCLNIKPSSAYKKIRGDVGLSLDEALLLAQAFNISLDRFLAPQTGIVPFRFSALPHKDLSPGRFLDDLLHMLRQLRAGNNPVIRYATNEIPVAYYLAFPELAAFKMLVWIATNRQPTFRPAAGMPWIQDILTDTTLQQKRENIFRLFLQTPSVEYYPSTLLDNTYHQIQYFLASGFISASFAETVAAQIRLLIGQLAEAAQTGNKLPFSGENPAEPSATLDLYYNEMLYINNLVLCVNDQGKLLISTLFSAQYLTTDEESTTDYVLNWFEHLTRKSIPVSRNNEKQQSWFFNQIADKIVQYEQALTTAVLN